MIILQDFVLFVVYFNIIQQGAGLSMSCMSECKVEASKVEMQG